MRRTAILGAASLLLASSTAFAQATAFEVASIRPAADTAVGVRVGFQATGSQVRVTAMSAPLSKFGLTFDARRAPLEVIVVDSLLKTPTEN